MRALLLVDIQNDFLPGGALGVPEGDRVIAVANRVQSAFGEVIATQDWHPADHGSFAANHVDKTPGDVIELAGLEQILWPVHCVQGEEGSRLAASLRRDRIGKIFFKGTGRTVDSYSAFADNANRRTTGLADYLQERGVEELYIMGLATDYCVLFSVLDACRLGLRTHVIVDGCRGVDLQAGDSEAALAQMQAAGAHLVDSQTVLMSLQPSLQESSSQLSSAEPSRSAVAV